MIVLGRDRHGSFQGALSKTRSFPFHKSRKNAVGKILLRVLRVKVGAENVATSISVVHPDKPDKTKEVNLCEIGEFYFNPKDRKFRFILKDGSDFVRGTFRSDAEQKDLASIMESSKIKNMTSHSSQSFGTLRSSSKDAATGSGWQKCYFNRTNSRGNARAEYFESEVEWREPIHLPFLEPEDVIYHHSIVFLIINSNVHTFTLLRGALSHLHPNGIPTQFGLFRSPTDTKGLVLRKKLFLYKTMDHLEIRKIVTEEKEFLPVRIEIEEFHATTTIQLDTEIPIHHVIESIHSNHTSLSNNIPKECMKYFYLFSSKAHAALSKENPLSFYNISPLDTLILRRPPIYEFSQNNCSDTLIMRATATVQEALSELFRWALPPLYRDPRHYGLIACEEGEDNSIKHIWLSNTDTMATHNIFSGQKIILQHRKKGSDSVSDYDKIPRVVSVDLCPISLGTHLAASKKNVNIFCCAVGNEGNTTVLHLPEGKKEVLLPSEIVQGSLVGERIPYATNQSFGELILSNYQLLWIEKGNISRIPLGIIERIERVEETEEQSVITIECKIPLYYSFALQKDDTIMEFMRLLTTFAFQSIDGASSFTYSYSEPFRSIINETHNGWEVFDMLKEFERQGLVGNRKWRFSLVNRRFQMSKSYPNRIFVPNSITDEELMNVGQFRSKGRIPVLTYLHKNGNPICRASQPLVGIQNRRSVEDESLLDAIRLTGGSGKLVVFDARPKLNAIANQAKGAGYENMDKAYQNCEIRFLDIDNIHAIRNSYRIVRDLALALDSDAIRKDAGKHDWCSSLGHSHWFEYICLIIRGSVKIVKAITIDNSSVLVHCSDGWDRTAQLCGLAQIMLDPYFRTILGFEVLIEKDWLSFGHRFARRFGHADRHHADEQRSPIFYQFLDCVFQLLCQFPSAFEFNSYFLQEIALHTVSLRFGTFLFDTVGERKEFKLKQKTVSLWSYLNSKADEFTNIFYQPTSEGILPTESGSHLRLWDDFFLQSQCYHKEIVLRKKNCDSLSHRWKTEAQEWKDKSEALQREVEMLRAQISGK